MRRSAPANFGAPLPSAGGAKGWKPTIWHDSPPGCAGGTTYAALGPELCDLKDKLKASGATDADLATNADVMKLTATRTTSLNGSFLRASLFTSVVAFGIAALVMGLGLLFILIGFALTKVSTTVVVTETPAHAAGAAPLKA